MSSHYRDHLITLALSLPLRAAPPRWVVCPLVGRHRLYHVPSRTNPCRQASHLPRNPFPFPKRALTVDRAAIARFFDGQ